MSALVYKILPRALWDAAVAAGRFDGAAIDLTDGYIHFSDARTVRDTARLHFAGQADLLLVAVPVAALGAALKWEPSRGGTLFPHLYGPLDPALARWAKPLPLVDGVHQFPDLTA